MQQRETKVLVVGRTDVDGVVSGGEVIDMRPVKEAAFGYIGNGGTGMVDGQVLFGAKARRWSQVPLVFRR